jgi:alpha-1,3-rhamnosyl/mannosyltransferase
MMACGGAVVASTAGAVVETAGARAHLVHPEDCDGWRTAMIRLVEDNAWWKPLRKDVAQAAAPFTWEQCAADTLRAYRLVCGIETRFRAKKAA